MLEKGFLCLRAVISIIFATIRYVIKETLSRTRKSRSPYFEPNFKRKFLKEGEYGETISKLDEELLVWIG
jgi:hypothetical protein